MTRKRVAAVLAIGICVALCVRLRFEMEVDALVAQERVAEKRLRDWVAHINAQPIQGTPEEIQERKREAAERQIYLAAVNAGYVAHREASFREHLQQIKDGTLNGIASGRLCWYCKLPHTWANCPNR